MKIKATSQVLGVIGDPIAHSFSPDMHNAAIDALGIDFCYVAFRVKSEGVGAVVKGLREFGILGLNVTIPHKLAVMEHVDQISEEALAVGAVNTIHNEDGNLTGHNTDVYGVTTAIERVAGLTTFPETCVVLGAGGASRAVTYALGRRDEVRKVTILNRTLSRAEALAVDMEKITGKSIVPAALDQASEKAAFGDAGLVVNTTSVGMHPNTEHSPIIDTDSIRPDLVLYDTVFNPIETAIMQQFKEKGAPAYGGLDMLVFQGARSFEIWTGTEPPTDLMKQAVVGRFS